MCQGTETRTHLDMATTLDRRRWKTPSRTPNRKEISEQKITQEKNVADQQQEGSALQSNRNSQDPP